MHIDEPISGFVISFLYYNNQRKIPIFNASSLSIKRKREKNETFSTNPDDAFFNRNWAGAYGGRWAGPRRLVDGTGGCRITWAGVGLLQC